MRIETLRSGGMVVAATLLLLAAGGSALAQERTYEGDIIAVDGKANTFTVKATRPEEVAEMAFHVGDTAEVLIDGNREFLAELVKGDHVTVTYETSGGTNTVRRASRQKTASKEMTYTGTVSAVDVKDQILTVKGTRKGEVAEMQFVVEPATRLYLDGETELLAQFRPGDTVTISYDTANPTTHNIKHVKKGA